MQRSGAELIAHFQQERGLTTRTDAPWCDPSRFPDAKKAAERVREACERGEQIGIFGDYDCDGVTATAQLVRALRRKGAEPVVRLPHRVHDGYGLKPEHVDELHQVGVTLLITVDTGVSAHEAIEYANTLNIHVIVLDHHHVISPPNAFAILHPALAPHFPLPHPAAAGVVFSFLHSLEGGQWDDRATDLALAGMGTVADLVPLRGANRQLVQESLAAFEQLPEGPLKSWVEQVTGGRTLTSTDIAFRLAPRINAAGRMADPHLALDALLKGGALLNDLDTLNVLRQEQTTQTLEKVLQEISAVSQPFLSTASSTYPHGILGLLAGKLTEKFGLPSMAVHIEGDLCTASLRSPAHYNIVEALDRHRELLLNFGGHAQAAGATFALEQYIELVTRLEEDADTRIAEDERTPVLIIDAHLTTDDLHETLCTALKELEPHGQGNPEPTFLLRDITLEDIRRVGADGQHLQATIDGHKMIGFHLGHLEPQLNQPIDLACKIGLNTWNGRTSVQVSVQDVRHAKTQETSYKKQIISSTKK